jgi:hypothetical protein
LQKRLKGIVQGSLSSETPKTEAESWLLSHQILLQLLPGITETYKGRHKAPHI